MMGVSKRRAEGGRQEIGDWRQETLGRGDAETQGRWEEGRRQETGDRKGGTPEGNFDHLNHLLLSKAGLLFLAAG